MIKQAVDYREQLKQLYEAECKRIGESPRQFTQTEATWMPDAGMWDGPIEKLQDEGTENHLHFMIYGLLKIIYSLIEVPLQ